MTSSTDSTSSTSEFDLPTKDKKVKKYYKVVWHNCDQNYSDGGKYMGQEVGLFFADSRHPFFKIARKCKRLLHKIMPRHFSDGTLSTFESAAEGLDSRVPISLHEYNVCCKVFGAPQESFYYAGTPNGGGIQKCQVTLNDVVQSIQDELNEFGKLVTESNKKVDNIVMQIIQKCGTTTVDQQHYKDMVDVDRERFTSYEKALLKEKGLKVCYVDTNRFSSRQVVTKI